MKSTKKENTATPKEAQKTPKGWDYNRIREVRDAESAQRPSDGDLKRMAEEDANCAVMNQDQMVRSKASGCRPLDPRAGFGADMYCCPKD